MLMKVAVLIDFSNINSAFEIIKRDHKMPYRSRIDYIKLVTALTLGNEVISKSIYIETRLDVDQYKQKGFLDFFRNTGFTVVTKETKIIQQEDGSTKNKADFDVEIACDACKMILNRECDEIIIVSGDSDFAYLIDMAKELNFTISIVSTRATLSKELRERADRLVLLDDMDLSYLMFADRRMAVAA